jgi:hypothetical protein
MWNVDGNGNFVSAASPLYGPYPGWSATSYERLPDGTGRLLWSHEAGVAGLWNVDANGNYVSAASPLYGPYPGWSAQSFSE